jgi:hypothetical protein
MNPSYPSNASPFPQSHPAYHHHASPQGHSTNGVNPSSMPGQSHPAPYAYPVHHGPYPSHPFPHYSPYPQQIMMYAPPRPTAAHEAASQHPSTVNPSPGQMSTAKRKRKLTDDGQERDAEGGEEIAGPSGSTSGVMVSGQRASTQQSSLPPDAKKRTKTQRACDSCRSRKIRSVGLSSLAAIRNPPTSLSSPWLLMFLDSNSSLHPRADLASIRTDVTS